ENYGVLRVSAEGKEFLKNPYDINLFEAKKYTEDSSTPVMTQVGESACDEELYAILKDLCKQVAQENDLPPYVVFTEPSLEDMATQYPITMDELANIIGVGIGKAKRYGKPFIEAIKDYVEENEIERPDDMVVKSVVNKSGLKVFIIQ